MKRKFLKVSLSLAFLTTSLSLVGCGGRVTMTPPMQQDPGYSDPGYNNPGYSDPGYSDPGYSDPGYNNPGYDDRDPYGQSPVTGVPNTQSGSFKVDQDMANQWQAKGISVKGGTIYVSASDNSRLFKKGTVIKMNASDGKNWDDLGGSMLGLRHKMDATVGGLAVSGGSIIVVDSQSKTYTLDSSKGSVKENKGSGGTDVASGGGAVFISNGTVEKSDISGAARNPIPGLSATGGIGADNFGNVFAVSGNAIKKVDPSGQVMDVVMSDLAGPLDVAVDSRNGDIYVLESSMIKRFNASGQFIVSFSNGATRPIALDVDETGAVYVADSGTDHKTSKVIKFSPSVDSNGMGMNNPYGNNTYGGSGNYGSSYGGSTYGSTDPYGNSSYGGSYGGGTYGGSGNYGSSYGGSTYGSDPYGSGSYNSYGANTYNNGGSYAQANAYGNTNTYNNNAYGR